MLARAHLYSCLLLLLVCCSMRVPAHSGSVSLNYRIINGFPVKYVMINMNDPEVVVTTAVATNFPTHLEGWTSFLHRLQPDAAINGSYFCLRSFQPIGDVAVDGDLIYRGVVGTALCITPDRRVMMMPGPHQVKPDWRGFRTVLCAGPRLLTRGQSTINARAEGFRDPHVLGSARRSAVAWRPDGQLIFISIERDISLSNLAMVCRKLGATEAMALDGGTSSGLYAGGRTLTRPGRGLSNILAVYASPQRFRQATAQLVPSRQPTLARLLPDWESGSTYLALAHPFSAPIPTAFTPPPAAPTVHIVRPKADDPVRGTVPITVNVTMGDRVKWIALRINGKLRAITNYGPLIYNWDSTKEPDGVQLLEVSALTADNTPLAHDTRRVRVANTRRLASR